MVRNSVRSLLLPLLMVTAAPALAGKTARTTPVPDIQKLREEEAAKRPTSDPTSDGLSVGDGLGGVAAAQAWPQQGVSVMRPEPSWMLGGQLTSRGVACPAVRPHCERAPGSRPRTYRELRTSLRAKYAAMP